MAAAILASHYHPNLETRARIRSELEKWIADGGPAYSESEVRRVVESLRGTATAPFVIEAGDVDIAVTVARILFSARCGATRFRIVSRDALGELYGTTITSNLKTRTVGRGIGLPARPEAHGLALLVPSMLNEITSAVWDGDARAEGPAVHLECDDEGAAIVLSDRASPTNRSLSHVHLESAIRQSRFDMGATLRSLDIAMDWRANDIVVRPRSPEGALRLSVFQARRAVLMIVLGGGRDYHGPFARLFVRLEPAPGVDGDSRTELRSVATEHLHEIGKWLRFSLPEPLQLPATLRSTLVAHVALHTDWIDAGLAEALL